MLRGHKHNLVCTRTQDNGAVAPQETELDLPVSVQVSVPTVGCHKVRGTEYKGWQKSFGRRMPLHLP